MVLLRLLGGAVLEDPGGPLSGPATQRHRIALLALLAASPSLVVSRDKLMAFLWPERDRSAARKLLNQAAYVLRRDLAPDLIISQPDGLGLDDRRVRCDLIRFQQALKRGDLESAVEAYNGPFLDGFFLDRSPEFERWVDGERARLAAAYGNAMEALAERAEAAGDLGAAIDWWRARAGHDPYDSRVALRLMQAFAAYGNRAGALELAGIHRQLLEREFGTEPPPELRAFAEELSGPQSVAGPGSAPSSARSRSAGGTSRPPAGSQAPPGLEERKVGGHLVAVAAALGLGMALVALFVVGSGLENPLAPPTHGPVLEPGPDADRVSAPTEDIAVHELVRLARDPTRLRSYDAARERLELLQRAVTLDPTHAEAHAGLAQASLRLSSEPEFELPRETTLRRAEGAAMEAVALDPSSAEAWATLGLVRMHRYDFASAERELHRAIQIDPAFVSAREWMVSVHIIMGRPGEALAEAERALDLAPLSPSAHAEFARALLVNDRCEEAIGHLERLRTLDPPLLRAPHIVAQCHGRAGRWDEAVAAVQAGTHPRQPWEEGLIAHVLARAGRYAEADNLLRSLIGRWEQDPKFGAYPLALGYAGLGDLDQAFHWLERSVDDHSLHLHAGDRLLMEPLFEDLRRDPRFADLGRRLGLDS